MKVSLHTCANHSAALMRLRKCIQLRESKPELFFSRLVNKAWYGIFGAEDMVKVRWDMLRATTNWFETDAIVVVEFSNTVGTI